MDHIIPISEARANLGELLEEARDHEIFILKHGRPAGVIVSVEAYEHAMSRIEDLEDALAVAHAAKDTIPFVRPTDRELASA